MQPDRIASSHLPILEHDLVRKVCNSSGSCSSLKSGAGGKMSGGNLVKLHADGRHRNRSSVSRAIRTAIIWLAFPAFAFAQDAALLAAGEAAWDKAGCLQCHGAAGEGGAGGEFPAGPSLRKTRLDRAALVEAISCGLPGTQMPSW